MFCIKLQGTVAVLHSRGIINADLKLENVLLRRPQPADGGCPGSSCPEVVIADFGSAFSVTETDTSRLAFEMQSLPYRAPEVIQLRAFRMHLETRHGCLCDFLSRMPAIGSML